MGAVHPVFFILIIFIGLVILFYMFRKQYERVTIPSNLLWEQIMNEHQASPWLDKLQRNILLLLQLLILLFIMLALVRPYWSTEGIPAENIIVILDRSASMSAEHKEMARFDEAKLQLKELTKKISDQEVTLIGTGNVPEVVVNREKNIKTIEQAIDQMELTYENSNMEKAIQYATSMAVNLDAIIYIYSDSVTEDNFSELTDDLYVHVINVGDPGVNVSLTSFGVGAIDDEVIGLLVIENKSEREMPALIQIHSEDQLIFEQSLTLNPKEQEIIKTPNLPIKDCYKATIITDDDYKIDNSMTTLYQSTPTKFYLLGDVSPFIVKGLESLGPEVIQLDEDGMEIDYSDGIIVVESVPVNAWPNRPVFAVTPEKDSELELNESISVKDDSILHYVNLDKVYVKSAYNHLDELSSIANSGESSLIQKGIINGNPAVVVNFSIENSDWPLHTGFPIFLYNAFHWLTEQENFVGFFQPGEKRWLNVDPDNSDWKIFNENGEFIQSFRLTEESFIAPKMPGLYQAIVGEQTIYFSVYLDDQAKSIQSEPSFTINPTGNHSMKDDHRPYENSWYWLTLLGLALLFVEWEVMRRGNRA